MERDNTTKNKKKKLKKKKSQEEIRPDRSIMAREILKIEKGPVLVPEGTVGHSLQHLNETKSANSFLLIFRHL